VNPSVNTTLSAKIVLASFLLDFGFNLDGCKVETGLKIACQSVQQEVFLLFLFIDFIFSTNVLAHLVRNLGLLSSDKNKYFDIIPQFS